MVGEPPSGRTERPVDLAPGHRPRVSVLVLCFNYGRFLRSCVRSILDQEGVEVDVLVIDDASTDDTAEVAADLAADDDRVRWLTNERNLGMVPSVNRGFALLDGTYVVKFDADDLLTPGSLRRSVALLEAEPSVGFVYGRAVEFGDHPPRRYRHRARSWTVWSGRDWVELLCRRGTNVISQPEVVIRRATLDRVGPVNEALPHTSDLELWLRLASHGDVGRVNGAHQGWYRVHPGSMQRTVNAGQLTDVTGRLDAFTSALDRPDGLEDAAELLGLARRRLAEEAVDRVLRAYERGRADDETVDGLVDIARSLDPDVVDRSGAGIVAARARGPHHPASVTRALKRRAAEELMTARWRRTGV